MSEPTAALSSEQQVALLNEMLDVQEKLNQSLSMTWRDENHSWETAILVEAGELIEHLPWKWWKKTQHADWGQARMEVIDLWHFVLSMFLQKEGVGYKVGTGQLEAAQELVGSRNVHDSEAPRLAVLHTRMLVESALGYDKLAALYRLLCLSNACGLSLADVYKLYIGKVKLNQFRWANNYNTTYLKDWLGEEDNQFLTKILSSLDVSDPEFSTKVEDGLKARYAEVVAANNSMHE